MKDLRILSDDELMKSSDQSILTEREATTNVLHHFREIERRRLFSAYKFGSLFEMAMKHFGYTEDQANARISAMRFLKELPELEAKINSGALTLTHINMARTHFRNEKKHGGKIATREQMLELVQKMEKTSKRQALILLQSESTLPLVLPHDEIKPIGEDKIFVKFAADCSLESDLKALKGLLAHKNPNLSLGELFKKLSELGLEQWSPAKEPQKRQKLKTKNLSESPGPERGAEGKNQSHSSINRYIWRRDNSKCTNCNSTFAPERDHRIPRAKGGNNSAENQRILCRSCNQRAAIDEFGQKLMDKYLN